MNIPVEDLKQGAEVRTNLIPEEFLKKDIFTYSEIPRKQTNEISLRKQVHDVIDYLSFNPLRIDKKCSIWQGEIGIGHRFFIIYKNNNVNGGTENLALQKMEYPVFVADVLDNKDIHIPLEPFTTKEERKNKELKNLFEENRFFISENIFEESILKYVAKKLGFERILNDYLLENAEIDNKILFATRTKLLTFGNKVYPDLARYNDHTLMVTNTKTGKSTILGKICGNYKYGSGTESRLLGYSGSDNVYRGDLNGSYKPIALDEFTTAGYKDDLLSACAGVMENGKENVGKGCQTQNIQSSSSFTSATNVETMNITPEQLALDMEKAIKRLGGNVGQRIGSRIALDLFGNDFKQVQVVKERKLFVDDILTNKLLTETLFNKLSDVLNESVKDTKIEVWLNKEIPDYKDNVDMLLKGAMISQRVMDYWKSKPQGFRHARGMALKSALINYACNDYEIAFGKEVDYDKLIELAEIELGLLINYNLDSLQKITKIDMKHAEYFRNRFKSLPVYQKILVSAIVNHYNENSGNNGKIIPLTDIAEEIRTFGNRFNAEKYSSISGFLQTLTDIKKMDKINDNLKIFGVELAVKGDEYAVLSRNTISELEVVLSGINGGDS